ncbi:hypothetical protein Ccrd_019971, partial [Cynara cardunculus var. scolymus]
IKGLVWSFIAGLSPDYDTSTTIFSSGNNSGKYDLSGMAVLSMGLTNGCGSLVLTGMVVTKSGSESTTWIQFAYTYNKERLTAEIIELITAILDENLPNPQQMLNLSGFSVLGFLLQSVGYQQLNMDTLSAMFLIQQFDNDPRLLESLCCFPRDNMPECSLLLDTLELFACNPEVDTGLAKCLLHSLQLAPEKTVSSYRTLDAIPRVLKVSCIQAQEFKKSNSPGTMHKK